MKTLIINGSPRTKGDTVALLTELKKYLNYINYNKDTHHNNSKMQANPKAEQRKTLLMQLLKKKREKDGDDLLAQLASKP